MAEEYDPLDPPTFNPADDSDEVEQQSYEPGDEVPDDDAADDAADEDDDYDPSSFSYGADTEQPETAETEATPQDAPAQTEQPRKPQQTVAGFIVEESDDEQDESAAAPPQINGGSDAEKNDAEKDIEAQDVLLRSAPQDTATSSTSLNGSTTIPVPASTSSLPDSTLQTSVADLGKDVLTPVESAAPTPLPQADTSAPAVTLPITQMNGSIPAVQTRLPHDKVGQLEDRIKDDPKGDIDAWLSLIKHYYDKTQYQGARDVYKRFLAVFPTAVSMWVKYIQMENELDERDNVVHILGESVMTVPSVELWKLYLDHVRRALPLINDTDGKNRSEISKAFDVTLDNVGIDPDAGILWREYIAFLRDGPGMISGQGWQDLQKVDLLRKAYQRATKLPHSEAVKLWKEYENFEMGLHKATGRKHVQEQSPHYMQARTARMQLEQRLDGLDRRSIPVLPPLYGCAGEDEFGTQVEKWRSWIEWEKNEDPLVFKGTEDDAWRKRVLYAYKQATLSLCFYPPMWFEAASWCFSQGIDAFTTEGEQFLEKGMANNPESVLLAMSKADRVESTLETGNTEEILIRNGDKLDVPYEQVHTALYALRVRLKEKDDKIIAQINAHFASLSPEEEPTTTQEDDDDDQPSDKPKTRAEQLKAAIEAVKQASAAHMDLLKRTISYVWVAKMRAFRRVQGQGKPPKKGDTTTKVAKGFRGIFADARPRGQLSSDVYIASALLEWRCYKDPSAIKIFERGMKLFPLDEVFILEYVKHLIALSDVTNARVVFESTIPKIVNASDLSLEQKREKCRPLIAYMHDYESKYGDLAQIHKIEKRMAELYPEEPEISRFSHRFSLPDFDAMHVQLVLSPTQARPRAFEPQQPAPPQAPAASIENIHGSPRGAAPEILLGPNGPYVASPKRHLEDSDNEGPQRKFMRGESPLKGAAGLRMQGKAGGTGGGGFATKTFLPNSVTVPSGPPPLPPMIEYVLRQMPAAREYNQARFDAVKIAYLVASTDVDSARAAFNRGELQRR